MSRSSSNSSSVHSEHSSSSTSSPPPPPSPPKYPCMLPEALQALSISIVFTVVSIQKLMYGTQRVFMFSETAMGVSHLLFMTEARR
ncbi:hypothetical protein KIPB_015733, partial [Kipferlia bialata]|eukprot:g15733.t1